MTYLTQPLAAHAEQRPNDIALSCDDQHLTWLELLNKVEALGAWVSAETPANGSVAIDLPTSIDFAASFLASVHVGRRAVVYDHHWSETVRTDVEESLVADVSITPESYPDIIASPPAFDVCISPSAETPLMVGFTSGSTGKVKGYERTHGSWVSSINTAQSIFSITAEDRVCAPGSVSFSLFLYALAHCVYVGASLRLCPNFQLKRILQEMRHDNSTVLLAVPTQAKLLIDAASRSGNLVSDTLHMIITSGAKWRGGLTESHRRVIPDVDILEFYGASELSFVSVARESDNPRQNSVGKPFDGVLVDIRSVDGISLNPGQTGVIWVKSPMLFTRYIVGESPESKWDDDGYFTVGDHGYLDHDGYLYVVGREKRMLVTSGANLYPEAVEAVIARHESIENVSVIGIDETLRGQRVVAFLKLNPDGYKPKAREIAEICGSKLGRHAIPSKFFLVDDWPLAASGKTNHQRLLELLNAPVKLPQL